jgi:hypothetical protein
VPAIVDFSLDDVIGAAEQIIKADTRTSRGEAWTLEDEIALIVLSLEVSTHHTATAARVDTPKPFVPNHAAPPANSDAPGLVIMGLFMLLVVVSIMLVNSYFHATYGV